MDQTNTLYAITVVGGIYSLQVGVPLGPISPVQPCRTICAAADWSPRHWLPPPRRPRRLSCCLAAQTILAPATYLEQDGTEVNEDTKSLTRGVVSDFHNLMTAPLCADTDANACTGRWNPWPHGRVLPRGVLGLLLQEEVGSPSDDHSLRRLGRQQRASRDNQRQHAVKD